MRGMKILQNLGCDIRILELDGDAKDPDEYVIKYGSGRFERCVENAISLVEFKVKNLKKSLDLNQVNDKIKFLNEVSKILLKVDNVIEKEVYIDKISDEYSISKEAIYAQLNKLAYSNSVNSKILDRPSTIQRVNITQERKSPEKNNSKENLIILLLINEGQTVYQRIKDDISPNDFKESKNKKIAEILYEELEKGDISNVIGLFEKDEELVSHITYILSKELDISDIDKAIEDLIGKFIKEKLLEEKNVILKKLISGGLDNDETREIENRLKEISKKLVSIK